MKIALTLAAAFGILAAPAVAESVEQRIMSDLWAKGFTQIEIEHDDGMIEVEANKGPREYEMTYNRAGRLVEYDRDFDDDDHHLAAGL